MSLARACVRAYTPGIEKFRRCAHIPLIPVRITHCGLKQIIGFLYMPPRNHYPGEMVVHLTDSLQISPKLNRLTFYDDEGKRYEYSTTDSSKHTSCPAVPVLRTFSAADSLICIGDNLIRKRAHFFGPRVVECGPKRPLFSLRSGFGKGS